MYIYALALENNKYYIGKTNNINNRLNQHQYSHLGSEWTKLHNVKELIESYPLETNLDEDILTKKYMMKYGIENVRGGSYCQIELFDWQIMALENEFSSAYDLCYTCGSKYHFANNCPCNNFEGTIEELEAKIAEFEELKKYINQTKELIEQLKYINIYQTTNCIKKEELEKYNIKDGKIEINPNMIQKFNLKLPINRNNLLSTNILICFADRYNCEEDIYKIYIQRIKLEHEYYTKIYNICKITPDKINNDAIDSILLSLYKQLANRLTNLLDISKIGK